MCQTLPPSGRPLAEQTGAVLIQADVGHLLVERVFQILCCSEFPPLETSLDTWVQPKIIQREVRGVGGLRDDSPAKVSEVLQGESSGV